MENKPNKIIVHHDGVERAGDSLDAINQSHKERGFPVSSYGYFVGYHYLIEKTGVVLRMRHISEEGMHTIGQNDTSIGVGLAGDFDTGWPTEAQRDALDRKSVV